jgi:DNA-directed RNA polymerase specialized sigma24 family protein
LDWLAVGLSLYCARCNIGRNYRRQRKSLIRIAIPKIKEKNMNVYEKKEILLRFKKNRTRRPDDSDERRLEQEIRSAILKLKDEKQKKAMLFRYMDALSVEQAAEQMDLSPRQVIRITNQALEELELS